MKTEDQRLLDSLNRLFPNPRCALNFDNPFQCLCAVMLSAQTTDDSVNKVTPKLFADYPTPNELSKARLEDVMECIHSIGLYKNKAKNLLGIAKDLVERFGGEVPSDKEALQTLPGVGIKTANVVGALCFDIPAIAVDTHVARVSARLGYAKEGEDPVSIEKKLEKRFPEEIHIRLHHQLIWFGRTVCQAKKPQCGECPVQEMCRYFKKNSSMQGKKS